MHRAAAPSRPRPAQEPSVWAPLREPNFRALWATALVSNVGFWMQGVGAAWLMASISRSPALIALVPSATGLATVVLALPAGALADVVDRRRLLLATQAGGLVGAALLALLTSVGGMAPWELLALVFVLGVGNALTGPAWQAFIPRLVPRGALTGAVALNAVQVNIARAAGPALAGLVVAAAGPACAFLGNAVSYVGLIQVLWRRTPSSGQAEPAAQVAGRLPAALADGLRAARSVHGLGPVLLRLALFSLPAGALPGLLPVIARQRLGLTAAGFGVLLAGFGAGAVVGAALAPAARRRLSAGARVALGSAVFALAMPTAGLAPHPGLALVATTSAGVGWINAITTLNVSTRSAVPEAQQGRGLAWYVLVLEGTLAVGGAGAGLVAQAAGVRAALAVAAGLMCAGVATGWRWPLPGDGERR